MNTGGSSASKGGHILVGSWTLPRRNVPLHIEGRSECQSESIAIHRERSCPDGVGRGGKRQGLVSPRREQTCRGGMLRLRSSAPTWL